MKPTLPLVLAATLACGVAVSADEAAAPRGTAPRVDLPLTFEKLWFRVDGKRREGYLTVDDGGFEFFAQKSSFDFPLERIQFISLGTTNWDVDTEWIVLAVGVKPPHDLVGLRDGAKWGFGGRTAQIYHELRRVLRRLGAAQFLAPAGFEPYEDPARDCALAIPQGWSTYLESLVVVDNRSTWGTTIISEQPIRRIDDENGGTPEDDLELLDAILAGESPGFFLERSAAGRGMGCAGLSKSARERVLARVQADPLFGDEYVTVEAPAAAPATLGNCDGMRVVGRSRRPDGVEVVLDLHAVAHGKSLYTFGLHALADRYEAFRKPYAAALATVRFGALSN